MIQLYAMLALIAAVVVLANAFGRRFAGGLLSQWVGPIGGTQVARLVQAAIVGVSVLVLGGPWEWAAAAVPLAFLGAAWGFPGYSLAPPFICLGVSRMEARGWVDTIGLAVNGVVACAPLALGAWWVGLPVWPRQAGPPRRRARRRGGWRGSPARISAGSGSGSMSTPRPRAGSRCPPPPQSSTPARPWASASS